MTAQANAVAICSERQGRAPLQPIPDGGFAGRQRLPLCRQLTAAQRMSASRPFQPFMEVPVVPPPPQANTLCGPRLEERRGSSVPAFPCSFLQRGPEKTPYLAQLQPLRGHGGTPEGCRQKRCTRRGFSRSRQSRLSPTLHVPDQKRRRLRRHSGLRSVSFRTSARRCVSGFGRLRSPVARRSGSSTAWNRG